MNLLAKKLAHLLVENTNNYYAEDEIRYGLEIALGALFQIILIIMAAVPLGVGQEAMAIIAAAGLYRRYTGGPHCQAYYRCTITSLVTYILMSYISKYISDLFLPIYTIFTTVLSLLVIHHLVPVDNPTNTIIDESLKKKMKVQSYLVLLLLVTASIWTGYFLKQKPIALALLLGILWQNFTLLPWGHVYIQLWDQFFERIEKIFTREEVFKC